MQVERPIDAITVENLSHGYTTGTQQATILDQACFNVAEGQTVALIGRSGSGKSTLLNLISGLEPIQSGEVMLKGNALGKLNDSDRTRLRAAKIGFVYQSFNLIPTLTIADNISLPLALQGVARKKQHERVDDLLSTIGLENRGLDFPDQLSGGEQQRVAIARALIHRPTLILADEPTGNLDASSGRMALDLLQQQVEEQNASLLLVTHSSEVASVADKVLLLDQAQVQTLDTGALANNATW